MSKKKCDYCERSFKKISIDCENEPQHKQADFAERVADAIESDLRGRRGMDWGTIDDETQDEIRKTWASIIRENTLPKEKK